MHCIMGPAIAGRSEDTQGWYRKDIMHSPLVSDSPELESRLHLLETSQINITSPSLGFLLYKMEISTPTSSCENEIK